jgi:hypothetical protein
MARIGGSPRSRLAYQPDERWDETPRPEPKDDVVVELDDHRARPITYEMDDDEAREVGEDPPEGKPSEGSFDHNLALNYDEDFLDKLGADLIEKIEAAIEERRPWRDRFERGLEMMGLVESDIDDGPFPGASNAVHPLLIEAVTNFWARAMGELFPPEGPFKGKVEGKQTKDLLDRAGRVADYMNFETRMRDKGYVEEKSRLTWMLPYYGSAFSKTFRDPTRRQNITIYVPAEDMIVPAEATNLATAAFFAHRMRKSPNEVRRLQIAKHYRKVELDLPPQEELDEVETLKNESEDVEPDGDDNSNRHELFEVAVDLSLEGDEHIDEDGEETGLERTYYVTVDHHSGKVLSIYRGWGENDILCERKVYVEHWKFTPGHGFYGFGFFHLIGGLQTAATGALRVLLDSAASASLSGGFVSLHANLKGKRLVLTPGHWEPVDASAEDLQKAFFSPPVKEPSQALFQLLGLLTERGEKFTATTELQTGDGDPKNAPVGTTSMMIEQGGKVMSTIHRMMHGNLGREGLQRYELCQRYAPPDGYPYEVLDQDRTVYADDFAPGVGVEPISDPNIFSSAQRMAQAQAVYQMAMESGVIPVAKAVRRVLQAMRAPDIDDLIPEDVEPMAYDPAGEIQALLMGKPVKVIPEQPHVLHLQVLWAFASNPQFGANEQVQKQIGPGLMSIIGQHMAYAWATHVRGLGVPVGYMDPQSGQIGPVQGQGTPEQIAAMLAQVAPNLASVPGLPPIEDPNKKGNDKGQLQIEYAKLEIAREAHQQEMQQEREKHEFEIQKEQSKLEAQKKMDETKVGLAIQKGQNDVAVAKAKADQAMQQTQIEGQVKTQQAHQQMHLDQQNAQQQAQLQQHEMHQQHAMGQQKMAHEQAMGQQKLAAGEQQNAQKLQHTAQQQEMQSAGPGQPPVDRLAHLRQKAPPHTPGGDGGVM